MTKRALVIAVGVIVCFFGLARAGAQSAGSTAPVGASAVALSNDVSLSWQPVANATTYRIYRATSLTGAKQLVGSVASSRTSYDDTAASNGITYYYTVRSIVGGVESTDSQVIQSTPDVRSCSSSNPIVAENCYPGSDAWTIANDPDVAGGGIDVFATAQSVNQGGSLDIKVNTTANAPYHLEIWRSGYYQSLGARPFYSVMSLRGVAQPACVTNATTGLIDCSNWSSAATITTTASWPSGVYIVRAVRDDHSADHQTIFVVRNDSGASPIAYEIPMNTYEAYNAWGGKSLYDYNSTGADTVAGTARAVKVSFDRPFLQPRLGIWGEINYFGFVDLPLTSWIESQGYNISYLSDSDLQTSPASLLTHKTIIAGAHSEYWSAEMRSALTAARDARVSLLFAGGNSIYWKTRSESSPTSGVANRVLVCYKSTQSGGADPTGVPTGTWRDPAGANDPENALAGEMYVGDHDAMGFPLVVSSAQGKDRIWRNTSVANLPTGSSVGIGTELVSWEWDSPIANGRGPSNLQIVAASPVDGNLIQGNGASTTPGSAISNATKYIASSGALVFATGANQWELGLGLDSNGGGQPDIRIQQAFVNILSDMAVSPTTPSSGITVTAPSSAAPTGLAAQLQPTSVTLTWSARSGTDGYNVYRTTSPRVGGSPLGTKLNTTPVQTPTFADTGLTPTTSYYYVVRAVAGVVESSSSSELKATTPPLPPLTVPGKLPASGATNVSPLTRVTATFSRAVDAGTISTSSVTLSTGGQGVPGTVTYDSSSTSATLTPSQALLPSATYTVTLAASITSADGVALGSPVSWSFTTSNTTPAPPTVTSVSPPAGQPNVSTATKVTATFSRAMDPATMTSGLVQLLTGSQTVAATVAYSAVTNTVTLTPSQALISGTAYTAKLSANIAALDGTPLGSVFSWQFTTAGCPCQLFSASLTPTSQGNPVQDGRVGSGPWSYELGVRVSVASPVYLTSIRFYKDPTENGTHVGRLWSSTGTLLSQVTFTNETSSGWQQQPILAPYQLQPGAIYTVSVNANNSFGVTTLGLVSAISSGPLQSIADGSNGVFGAAAGVFPTSSYSASNYFVDPVVSPTIPLIVTAQTPGQGSTGISPSTDVTATFSRALDTSTLTSGAFTVSTGGQNVAGTLSYVGASNRVVFTPSAPLGLAKTYTATLASTIRSSDGTVSLGSPVSWTFTTAAAPPAPPTVTATSPASQAASVALGAPVQATFSRSMDATTLTSSTMTISGPGGSVAGVVSYNDTTRTATLTPSSPFALGTTYTVTISGSAKAADGTPLGSAVSWQFTTLSCPCSLFSSVLTPASTGNPVRDGRAGTGPFSYEFGVKVTVTQAIYLTAVRYYRDPLESGSHIGRVWTASGAQLAQVAFSNETASGWQQQALATPLQLQPGVTYVFSVNVNASFGFTGGALASQVSSGAVQSVADGANGIFGSAAGVFPTGAYNSSNYFVDGVVSQTLPFTVTSTSPAAGATGTSASAPVSATFVRAADPTTVSSSTFTVKDGAGNAVAGSVSYNSGSNQAVFTPSAALAQSTTYTATVAGSVKSADGASLGSPVTWSFTTSAPAPPPPSVTATAPSSGAIGVGPGVAVTTTFSRSMDPASLTTATFSMVDGGGNPVAGSVSYDAGSNQAVFTPAAALALGTTYTVTVAGSASAADGIPLGSAVSWQFTTLSCPCSLFSSVLTPASGGNPVQDGRSGAGPFTYEFGVKVTVSQPVSLTSLRFYRDALESGSHIGRVWTASGVQLAQVAFTNETASGWQQQALDTPLQLQPGVTYVFSVNMNASFGFTGGAFASSLVSGPLASVADGANGVFGSDAGVFPTGSYNNSNYFVDGVVQ